jgi:transcriptional regulator with XRE-family HTH domain
MTLAEQFGRRLFRERPRLGVSHEELARFAGLHRTEVQKLEKGRREPRVSTIVALAQALGIDPGRLVQGLEPEPENRVEEPAPVRLKQFVPFAGGSADDG